MGELDALERRIEWEAGNPGLTCARCHDICEAAGRPFVCQARDPCPRLSADNQTAMEIFAAARALAACRIGGLQDALGLFDVTVTPGGLQRLRLRIVTLCMLALR